MWIVLKICNMSGRNEMHRYNNQDHSMLSAILAAENIIRANHNPWKVNTERSYHEEFTTKSDGCISLLKPKHKFIA
ncbi:MAG UNVERIFIED_CONTAM: hypothetical protein LVR29_15525 [Microcystis novacekii LVE1205-3]